MNKIVEAILIEKVAVASDFYNYNSAVNEIRDNRFMRPVTEEEYANVVRGAMARNIKNIKSRWSEQKGRADAGELQTKEELRGAVIGHGFVGGTGGAILGGIFSKILKGMLKSTGSKTVGVGIAAGGIGGSILAGLRRKAKGPQSIKDPGLEDDFQQLGKGKELAKELKNPKSELYKRIIADPTRKAERRYLRYPDDSDIIDEI